MTFQRANNSQERFERALQALELDQQMQRDRLEYGNDYINLYVEDIEGDWLAKWGEEDTNPEQESKIALLTKNASQIPKLFEKLRLILEKRIINPPEYFDIDKLINQIIKEFARIISSIERDEWPFAAAYTLEQIWQVKSEGVLNLGGTRQEANTDDEIEMSEESLIEMSEELLHEVEEFWEIEAIE